MKSRLSRILLLLSCVFLIVVACNLPGTTGDTATATPEEAPHDLPAETVAATESVISETASPEPVEEVTEASPATTGCNIAYASGASVFCAIPDRAPLLLASASAPVADLAISGDGALLAYLVQTAIEAYELWVVPTDASAPARMLVNNAPLARPDSTYTFSPYHPVWRGSTHEIYFMTYTGGLEGPGERPNYDVWKVDADSSALSQILPDNSGIFYLSPDGQRMALSQPEFIEVRNADGSNPLNVLSFVFITTYSEYAYKPEIVWANDSGSFTFGVPSTDPLATDAAMIFYRVSADGSSTTTLGSIVGNFVFGGLPRPTLSTDGQYAVYGVNVNNDTVLHLIRTDGALNTILGTYPGSVRWAGWSPDSGQFAYALEPTGGMLASLSGTATPFFPEAIRVSHARWLTPTKVVYIGLNGSTWGLYVKSINGSVQPIIEGLSEEPPFTIR